MLGGINCTSLLNRKARLFFSSGVQSARALLVQEEELGLDAVSEMPEEIMLSFDSRERFSVAGPSASSSVKIQVELSNTNSLLTNKTFDLCRYIGIRFEIVCISTQRRCVAFSVKVTIMVFEE